MRFVKASGSDLGIGSDAGIGASGEGAPEDGELPETVPGALWEPLKAVDVELRQA